MNSQDDKLKFEQWDSTKIKEWLGNKDYVYKDLVLDTPVQIKALWPELDKCCIINVDHIENENNIGNFIRENEITLDCLKNTLIIPWENDGNPFFKLKSLQNFDIQIKHIFDINNFDACLILLKLFVKSCCKSVSIFEIQEYYDRISLFKTKIEKRYIKLKSEIQTYIDKDNLCWIQEVGNLSGISTAFINIDEYLENLLSLIQINIEKKKNDKKEWTFDKTFNQNRWLGWIAIIVSGVGVISGIIVPLIIKFCFK